MLEIGFGPGHLQADLYQKGYAIYGVDESPQMVRIANKRLARQGFRPKLVRGDAQWLPFANASFNQVVMTFPAEFIIKPASLAEVNRVLTTQGAAVILPFAWITGQKPWERIVAWVNRISGEAPDWDPRMLEALKQWGFDPRWEVIELANSKLVVICLDKVSTQ